jgi:hypothetical protein
MVIDYCMNDYEFVEPPRVTRIQNTQPLPTFVKFDDDELTTTSTLLLISGAMSLLCITIFLITQYNADTHNTHAHSPL